MRINFGSKPILYPMPVLIIGTYDENKNADAMNAAWGSIIDSDKITIALTKSHKTVKNLLKTKAFTVSMATEEYVSECDYFGIESGNRENDKIKKADLHIVESENVNAPLIEELPLALECQVFSYDEETEILIGKIVNVCADEKILTEGKIDVSKLKPITYDPENHVYLALGNKVGSAFADGKKFL